MVQLLQSTMRLLECPWLQQQHKSSVEACIRTLAMVGKELCCGDALLPPSHEDAAAQGYFCSSRALAPPAAMAGCPGEAAGWEPGGLALGCAFWAVILVTGVARGELKAGFGWEIPGVSLLGLGPETKPAFMAHFPRQDFALGLPVAAWLSTRVVSTESPCGKHCMVVRHRVGTAARALGFPFVIIGRALTSSSCWAFPTAKQRQCLFQSSVRLGGLQATWCCSGEGRMEILHPNLPRGFFSCI